MSFDVEYKANFYHNRSNSVALITRFTIEILQFFTTFV